MLISSTDKNFMVPVGGSLIYAPKKKQLVDQINKMYPGRASAAPITDIFITLLSMGETTFKRLLKERKENFKLLQAGLETVAKKYDEKVLVTLNNKISIAVTLTNLTDTCLKPRNLTATYFGSYLFSRRVSGVRVVDKTAKEQLVGGISFANYGSHSNNYPSLPYFTAAASIGQTKEEIAVFLEKLDDAFKKFKSNAIPPQVELIDTAEQ